MRGDRDLITPDDPDFAALLTSSHLRVVGRPLTPGGEPASTDMGRWLYRDAPFVLLAHRLSDDPLFCYANLAAQRCFGYSWDEFVGLPSRYSAATPDRAERDRLFEQVAEHGFIDDYRGLRIAKSGAQFWIDKATVWNLVDAEGALHGQAAAFDLPH
ncbi:MEKHLA domain-containing protein [Pseudonocardia spinosispora]|uniref:MEKHLA domain-containing protein n=1 Tax=Pseudonocardia spinosispora TaxID=103441 RepID=UPI000404B687|nr:MEKHLA domain-containing protein [Pseudonocardia spinosispora]